jgi:hypothetical protein
MNRSEVITGINALRHFLERIKHLDECDELSYYEDVLCECRDAVLLNEANDPHAPHMK